MTSIPPGGVWQPAISARIDGPGQITPRGAEAPDRPADIQRAPLRRGDDRVELSAARAEARPSQTGGIRTDLVERVRAELASGTYESDEKIDLAVDVVFARLSRFGRGD